jgi:ATP/maltotriose-dependent transcriptional regulator MalT
VDKSLVQFGDAGAGPGRYRLLETVRQYAAERLDAQGLQTAQAARMAHRDYYLALAEVAAPQLRAADQAAWLDRLDAELGNLRAAIAFSLTQADPGPGLRLAASLRVYWRVSGHVAEGADTLRALLDAPAAQEATLPRARALAAATRLLEKTDSYTIAEDYCQEALAIARAAGDELLVAELLCERAWVLVRQGQPGAALPLIESGLGVVRRLGEPHLTGRLLSARSYARFVEGDHAGAALDAAEGLRLSRPAGDRLQAGALLGNLGYYELLTGDLDAARRHLAESLGIFRVLNARSDIAYETFNLGLAEYLGGSLGAAEALFAESLNLARRMGMRAATAYALIGLAVAGRGGADRGWSARLHGAADQALADLGHALQPVEDRLAGLDRQRLRAAMGAEAFEADYAAGRTLDLAQLLAALGRTYAATGRLGEAYQVRPAVPAGSAGQRADALASERDAAVSGEAAMVLTPRERDVLKLVAQGLSNLDIAQRLVLSEHTVHRHLANILRKLDLSSRAAAAAWSVRTGLVLAWPDRAIRRGRMKLARTGDAAAAQFRISLVRSDLRRGLACGYHR